MHKKNSSATNIIVMIAAMLFVAFLAVHLSCAIDTAKKNTAQRKADGETLTTTEISYGMSVSEAVTDLTDRLRAPTKNIYYNGYTIKFLLAGEFMCFLVFQYMKASKKKYMNGKEYGSAEWADENTLKTLQSGYLYKQALKKAKTQEKKEKLKEMYELPDIKRKNWYKTDRIFTKTERICMFNYELNNNTLIIGGAGAGKSRGYVLPNLLQSNTSNIVTDPKGELYGKVGYFLTQIKGHRVRVLELGDFKNRSDCFNPLYYVHRDRDGWEERVLTLIETLITNTDGGQEQKGSDPFWPKAERLFLQAIIFAVVQAFPDEEVNFETVNTLIGWLSIEEDGDNYDSDLDIFFKEFAKMYGDNNIAVRQFNEFRSKASGKTAKSIVISAVARLSSMKIPEIQRILSRDDMHLDLVGEELTTIFVVKPPTVDECNYIAGMFFTILFQELNYCATVKHREDQRCPVPVHFYLDEFATTCRIPKFVEIQSYARSLGIGITVILQSLDQLKNIYEKEWGVVIDNSNTFLYLGNIGSMETLKYVSELLGKATIDKKSSSRSKGKSGSSSQSFDRMGRELMMPDEIKKLPKKECLLFVSGKAPFRSEKFDYSQHPYYKYSSDYDKSLFYEHVPEYLKDKENEKDKAEIPVPEKTEIRREPAAQAVTETKPAAASDDAVREVGKSSVPDVDIDALIDDILYGDEMPKELPEMNSSKNSIIDELLDENGRIDEQALDNKLDEIISDTDKAGVISDDDLDSLLELLGVGEADAVDSAS